MPSAPAAWAWIWLMPSAWRPRTISGLFDDDTTKKPIALSIQTAAELTAEEPQHFKLGAVSCGSSPPTSTTPSAWICWNVRDPQHLIRVMSTNPSYLRTAQDGQVSNFRDWHIQLGRRFRALKLWFYLMDVGVEGLQARVRRDLENAQWLKEQVDAAPDWERLTPVSLQTVCIRHLKPSIDAAALAAHNLNIAHRINDSGHAYLTPSVLKGTQMLRVSIGAETTERRHAQALWEALKESAAQT